MASVWEYFTQGSRIVISSWKNRLFNKKYEGHATEICEQIVKDCWNGRYFQTSTTNFPQFWTRDFGWCTQSLVKLGYQKEVHQTLRYALNRFKEYNKITTSITPKGKPFDFPTMAVDSLPWLIHSIKVSKFPYYSFRKFLIKEIKKYYEQVVNEHTGLVKPNKHFSSMKDYTIRKSSCYDNCMLGMLAKDLVGVKLINPFKKFNYPELVKRHFWNGEYFFDDLKQQKFVAGDANLFPFLILSDEEILKKAVTAIEEAELDQPFPLKYTRSRAGINFIWEEFFMRNYESNAIWMHMGPLYIKLLKEIDPEKAKEFKLKYKELIEKHSNYLEVFNTDGKPFKSPFYYCDSGMLWAANYLTL